MVASRPESFCALGSTLRRVVFLGFEFTLLRRYVAPLFASEILLNSPFPFLCYDAASQAFSAGLNRFRFIEIGVRLVCRATFTSEVLLKVLLFLVMYFFLSLIMALFN